MAVNSQVLPQGYRGRFAPTDNNDYLGLAMTGEVSLLCKMKALADSSAAEAMAGARPKMEESEIPRIATVGAQPQQA